MLRIVEAMAPGAWSVEDCIDTLVLDYQARARRRFRVGGESGVSYLLDLAETTVLQNGTGLRTEDGSWIAVVAADEELVEVSTTSPLVLARLAWHLGNRHLPAEIRPTCIRIHPDRVIENMLEANGATLNSVRCPFNPERGAYAGATEHDGNEHHEHVGHKGHH
jgi:urease accessory protein